MFVLISKFILPLVQPLGVVSLLWLASLIWALRGRRTAARLGVLTGMAALLVLGNPRVGERLLGGLERVFPITAVAELPEADAIVVLGGVTEPPLAPRLEVESGPGIDRLLHGIRLLRAGRAPVMVLSGGVIESLVGSSMTEAARLCSLAVQCGAPRERLLLEGRSRNTHENALYTAELLADRGAARVLLVTSACHMPRAVAAFRTQGLEVVPASTDVRVVARPAHLGGIVPTLWGLECSTWALKEYVGWWVYRARGWID